MGRSRAGRPHALNWDSVKPHLIRRAILVRFAIGALVSSVAGAALISACARPSLPSSQPPTLTVGLGFGGTALAGARQYMVDSLSAEPLVAIDWNGRFQPRLATGWTWDDDGLTLRLHLKPGVFFHDGSPLTADVVVADLRRSLSPGVLDRVKSISAEGTSTVTFQLNAVDAFLLGQLNNVPVKKGNERLIGTGPFLLRTQSPELVFESFARYHQHPPAISKVLIKTYESPRSAWAAMMRGEINFLYEVSRNAVDFVEAESRLQTLSFPRPYYIPIVFNLNHPILGRREVRQAINEAIDRREIVEKALNRRGYPAEGPIWPQHWAYNPGVRSYNYNAAAARIRLDAAGFPVLLAGRGQMPKRFTFRCLFLIEDPLFEQIALVVQKQLFESGIDVEMVPATLKEIGERHPKGDFEALMMPMTSGRSLDWVSVFWRSAQQQQSGTVMSGYKGADAVLDRLRDARSDDETRIAVADLQRVLYDDPPAAFLVRTETARVIDQSFEIPIEAKGRDVVGTLSLWKPRPVPPVTARR
jgi:peptide/nickel transport system substrate-binding protein